MYCRCFRFTNPYTVHLYFTALSTVGLLGCYGADKIKCQDYTENGFSHTIVNKVADVNKLFENSLIYLSFVFFLELDSVQSKYKINCKHHI